MAVVPCSLGDIGFMHNHEIVVALLREGEVRIYDEKNELVKSVPVKSGSVKMQNDGKLLVLAE